MADLKLYDVNGRTLLLSDEDAKRQGLSGGKSRTNTYDVPELNKDLGGDQGGSLSAPGSEPVTTKARASANK